MYEEYLEDLLQCVIDNTDDYEEIKMIYLLVQDQIYRLQNYLALEIPNIKKNYNTLTTIELQLKEIMDRYE